MEVSTRLIDGAIEVLINGFMNEYSEYVDMKNIIKEKSNSDAKMIFYFVNASSISSYILGYILKLKEVDKRNIDIVVSNAKLYNFLQNIDFDHFFDIKITGILYISTLIALQLIFLALMCIGMESAMHQL